MTAFLGDFQQGYIEGRESRQSLVDELKLALQEAADALESFDGISIKGTKLHWSRSNRQALKAARKILARTA